MSKKKYNHSKGCKLYDLLRKIYFFASIIILFCVMTKLENIFKANHITVNATITKADCKYVNIVHFSYNQSYYVCDLEYIYPMYSDKSDERIDITPTNNQIQLQTSDDNQNDALIYKTKSLFLKMSNVPIINGTNKTIHYSKKEPLNVYNNEIFITDTELINIFSMVGIFAAVLTLLGYIIDDELKKSIPNYYYDSNRNIKKLIII
jgi:hypothetical protein